MRLTRFTDLALRILLYMSSTGPDRLVTVSELSERLEWTPNHLTKVVGLLAREGFIRSHRGRNGGLSFVEATRTVRLGDLVRRLEGGERLIDCGNPPCALRRGCTLVRALHEAQEAFYDSLNRFTLADALTPEFEGVIRILVEKGPIDKERPENDAS